MRLYCRRLDAAPAASLIAVNLRHAVDTSGPFFIGWVYWVNTADAGAGQLRWDLVYTDPSGATITIPGTNVNLNTGAARLSVPATVIEGQSGVSPMSLNPVLTGGGGVATVSLRLLFSSAAAEDIQPF